ncbi:cob(I)yrinic acid a,c-diamide adenosyltransferase [Geobacter benzoatilyticus]|jgi:cob(I)alamin adenosyltransferase|uniref:corrinoid adenosyltransferase n=1 Tax=Geobacter benzoatilyticus TaxID=2815309 RepID=A0ABX7Q1C3_9BACT|nr:cob(I)yrinic acid a,c-diamide adenosyltransferase [Geobacter benzoatilyticus]QSV45207.1 cob(I)yrinic acid a,c-diamide adenosyltransferase [Geobacter benzoatilyticus]
MKLDHGCIQVYTGNGKGKTTAALGLAFRALGRGLRVFMVQFMKGGGPYGEHAAAERFSSDFTIVQTGRPGWVNRENPDPEDVRLAGAALETARAALTGGEYDLVILDEVNGAVSFGLLNAEDVLELMAQKPSCVELVLTGRSADERIIAAADLVTEMREIKHYYRAGIPARVGIEK